MAVGNMPPQVGNDCKLYLDVTPVVGDIDWQAPTYVEINESSDVSLSEMSLSEAEVVTRASDWAYNLGAKFRAAIEFQYLYGANWPVLNILLQMFFNREIRPGWFADGDISSPDPHAQGLEGAWLMTQFPVNQPNEEAGMVDTCRMVPALKFTDPGVNTTRFFTNWVISTAVPPPLAALDPKKAMGTDLEMAAIAQAKGRLKFREPYVAIEAGYVPNSVPAGLPKDFLVYVSPEKAKAAKAGKAPTPSK